MPGHPSLLDFPIVLLALCILLLSVSAWVGVWLRGRSELEGESREDFGVVLAAALTLLGLIIGFSFSMATSRYDLRKSLEEAEANAIGTEYVRVDFLSVVEASAAKKLLRSYLDARVQWYRERDMERLRQIDGKTTQLQSALWSVIKTTAAAQPNPVLALTVSGMNDVLNAQGYTQAAWWNRIPPAAWILLVVIAVLCNAMIGYRAAKRKSRALMVMILPVIVSISFYLIADIDSPRSGVVKVVPQNLLALAASLPE